MNIAEIMHKQHNGFLDYLVKRLFVKNLCAETHDVFTYVDQKTFNLLTYWPCHCLLSPLSFSYQIWEKALQKRKTKRPPPPQKKKKKNTTVTNILPSILQTKSKSRHATMTKKQYGPGMLLTWKCLHSTKSHEPTEQNAVFRRLGFTYEHRNSKIMIFQTSLSINRKSATW